MAFTCPHCGRTSHNPNDEREGYCGNCNDWVRGPFAVMHSGRWPFQLHVEAEAESRSVYGPCPACGDWQVDVPDEMALYDPAAVEALFREHDREDHPGGLTVVYMQRRFRGDNMGDWPVFIEAHPSTIHWMRMVSLDHPLTWSQPPAFGAPVHANDALPVGSARFHFRDGRVEAFPTSLV